VLHFAELIRGLRQEKVQIGNMDDPEEACVPFVLLGHGTIFPKLKLPKVQRGGLRLDWP
jgi:hypothetical protein